MLDELQLSTLEVRRDRSSLLFFHKTLCGIMSIEKDKYLTPSQRTRYTRSSHNSQYCRPVGGGDGTLIFSYIHVRRLGSFFGVQIFEFQYFWGFSEK